MVVIVVLQVVFWSQYAWVGAHNFLGYDEWLHVSLLDRWIISFPYAHRPLMLIWSLPAAVAMRLLPVGFDVFYVFQGLYMAGAGVLVYLLCRRLVPGAPLVAFLAAVFATSWAPSDAFRLSSVSMMTYAGSMFGTLLAMLGLVESHLRGRRELLWAALAVALIAVLSFEAVYPTLAAAPFLLLVLRPAPAPLSWRVFAAWEATLLLALGPVLSGLLAKSAEPSYVALDLHPLRVAERLLHQYHLHLAPALMFGDTQPRELLARPVVIAVAAFFAGAAVAKSLLPSPSPSRRTGFAGMAIGLSMAALAYGPAALAPGVTEGTEYLSSAGIGVFLASTLASVAAPFPHPMRAALSIVLGGFIVAIGTARTASFQRWWNGVSRYPAQCAFLSSLRQAIPRVQPHTLVLVVDQAGTWPATFGLRHAVEYFYNRQATAVRWESPPILYESYMDPEGITSVPLPSLQKAWDAPTTRHGFEETIVIVWTRQGELVVARRWPEVLPAPPSNRRYDPAARILAGPVRNHPLLDGGTRCGVSSRSVSP